MITTLFRRLQGRPARLAPVPETAAPAPVGGLSAPATAQRVDYTLDAAELERRFLGWAFGLPRDGGVHDAQAADAAFDHLHAVAQRFDVRRMPRLPALMPQVLAAMRSEDSDAAEIAGLLARDPTLAGDVMRVANSAFYRRSQAPAGLQQAVQAIGTEGLRNVVLGNVMRPILRGDAGHPGFAAAARLWSHTEACAWLCGRLTAGRDDAGEAHLAGIVAGTGIAALSRMVPAALLADAAGDPAFVQRFLALARPIAARAGAHWHLPASVCATLRAISTGDGDSLPLVRTLRAADRLAMGYRLIETGELDEQAAWPTSDAGYDAPAPRTALFHAMAREIEPLDAKPTAA